jgi:hypothetical protein
MTPALHVGQLHGRLQPVGERLCRPHNAVVVRHGRVVRRGHVLAVPRQQEGPPQLRRVAHLRLVDRSQRGLRALAAVRQPAPPRAHIKHRRTAAAVGQQAGLPKRGQQVAVKHAHHHGHGQPRPVVAVEAQRGGGQRGARALRGGR